MKKILSCSLGLMAILLLSTQAFASHTVMVCSTKVKKHSNMQIEAIPLMVQKDRGQYQLYQPQFMGVSEKSAFIPDSARVVKTDTMFVLMYESKNGSGEYIHLYTDLDRSIVDVNYQGFQLHASSDFADTPNTYYSCIYPAM
jgi:hypothetical protein